MTAAVAGKSMGAVSGETDGRFARMADVFRSNFEEHNECGASCAVYLNGKLVVDLWGGSTDRSYTSEWKRDTIVNMMSVSKGFVASSLLQLVERKKVSLDEPVATYWPEFAENGKESIPVRWLLDHRAGLPVVTPNLPRGEIYNWEAITSALARQAPAWTPGQQSGYHILTMGFLVGEVVRRVSGLPVGTYVAQNISQPLGIDYQIGLPEKDLARCATFLPAVEGTIFDAERTDPDSFMARAWYELPRGEDFNSREWRMGCVPGANGHGNARAVSRFYGCLSIGGSLDGVTIMRPETVKLLGSEQHNNTEIVMGRTYHQALGVLRNSPPIVPMGPNANSFGHHGVGGAIGFADPDAGIGFSYAMNQMHARYDNGPRAGGLIKAMYECLG